MNLLNKLKQCFALLLSATLLFGSMPLEPIFVLAQDQSVFEAKLADDDELDADLQEEDTMLDSDNADYDSINSVYEYDEFHDGRIDFLEDHVTEVDEPQKEINIEESSDIVASGTVGPGGAPWTLDAEGVVRVGAGSISGTGIAFQSPWHAHRDSIREIIFTASVDGTSDLSSLFSNLPDVMSIEGLEHIDTSNVTHMDSMFRNTSGLTSLDVSNFDTRNVTSMRFMFLGASGLTSLDVSNFDTSNVTDMTSMFHTTSGLTSLDLSNFNTSSVTQMMGMFMGANHLTSLDLSSFDTSSVTSMPQMFMGASSLTSLDLSNFDTSSVTSMMFMFNGTSMLQKLVLGSDFSFLGNSGLPNVQATSEFTGYWQNVGNGTVANPVGDFVLTSAELMGQFDGSTMADTFVWQRYVRTVTLLWNHVDAPGNGIITTMPGRVGLPIAEPTVPTREGYEFVRWTTDPAGEDAWDFTIPIVSNLRLYAQWEAIEVLPPVQEWTATFMDDDRVVAAQTVEHESLLNEPEAPERAGYVFEGWYHEHDEGAPLFTSLLRAMTQRRWDFENDRVIGDIILQARWEVIEEPVVPPVQEWTATFMDGERVVATQTVEHESLLNEPEAPERAGYVFEGWYHEHDEDTPRLLRGIAQRKWDFENDRVIGDITLQARWSEVIEEDEGDGERPVNPTRSGLPQTGAVTTGVLLGGLVLIVSGVAIASKKRKDKK